MSDTDRMTKSSSTHLSRHRPQSLTHPWWAWPLLISGGAAPQVHGHCAFTTGFKITSVLTLKELFAYDFVVMWHNFQLLLQGNKQWLQCPVWFNSGSCRLNNKLALSCSLMVCWNQMLLCCWVHYLHKLILNQQTNLTEDNASCLWMSPVRTLTCGKNMSTHQSSFIFTRTASLTITVRFRTINNRFLPLFLVETDLKSSCRRVS